PSGSTATSRRSFDTSIPTAMISMATLPCLIGLRTLRPRRLFGFDGLTDGAPVSPTVCNDLGVCGLPSVTAPSTIPDERTFDLQGGPLHAFGIAETPPHPGPLPASGLREQGGSPAALKASRKHFRLRNLAGVSYPAFTLPLFSGGLDVRSRRLNRFNQTRICH